MWRSGKRRKPSWSDRQPQPVKTKRLLRLIRQQEQLVHQTTCLFADDDAYFLSFQSADGLPATFHLLTVSNLCLLKIYWLSYTLYLRFLKDLLTTVLIFIKKLSINAKKAAFRQQIIRMFSFRPPSSVRDKSVFFSYLF